MPKLTVVYLSFESDKQTEQMTRPKDVAELIVENALTDLCVDLRFMTNPVMSITVDVGEGDGPYGYDSGRLYFFSDRVISDYKVCPNLIARTISHMILHLVLGNFERDTDEMRNLAEDMIIEYTLDLLDSPSITVEGRDSRIYLFEELQKKAGSPTVDLLSARLHDLSAFRIAEYTKLFRRDSHERRDEGEHPEWTEISRQMMVEIEGFSKTLDGRSDALMRILRIRNSRHVDHLTFLRKFMSVRERMGVSMDEFDPIYYTYGLEHYGNVPLIDSLERSNSLVIEDFIVAIDTSGSTMRGPVIGFVQDVYRIMEQCRISERTNLHIIQCDDDIREDRVIRNRQDIRELLGGMIIKGGGRTDFRPVFRYVDELISEGRIKKPKGLIYFTDGIGIYPVRKPDYPVAFMFCDDRFLEHEVPVWAMKVTVRESELQIRDAE